MHQFSEGHLFINGSYRQGRGEEAKRINPATGNVDETIRYADSADVDDAVAAAKAAFAGWSRRTPGERAEAMLALAAELDRRSPELAELETAQTGKSIRMSTEFDVPGTVDNVSFFAGAARQLHGLAPGPKGARRPPQSPPPPAPPPAPA
ncbi:aldehyde dehydrogenase family protein, partial [Arthrobacter sp. 3Tela_A]|uniref:aldehyde dehydrogenase family protein n=1 Tax=Arthrobacter sp. 3Tela_A TaxID=3093743 RepID=UPI003BB5F81F